MDPPDDPERLTYADAGVDIAAGEKAVELIKAHVRSTFRSEVVGDVGGFGGLFAVDWKRYRDPLAQRVKRRRRLTAGTAEVAENLWGTSLRSRRSRR